MEQPSDNSSSSTNKESLSSSSESNPSLKSSSSEVSSLFISKSAIDKQTLKKQLASTELDEELDEESDHDVMSILNKKRKKSKSTTLTTKKLKRSTSDSSSKTDSFEGTKRLNRSSSSVDRNIPPSEIYSVDDDVVEVIQKPNQTNQHRANPVFPTHRHIHASDKVLEENPTVRKAWRLTHETEQTIKELKNKRTSRFLDSPPSSPPSKIEDEAIVLQLKDKSDGKIMKFRIARTDPIQKLYSYFAKYKGVSEQNLVLKYYGMSLNPSDTPETNYMTDQDIIEAGLTAPVQANEILEMKKSSNSVNLNTSTSTKPNSLLPLKQPAAISIDDDEDDFVPQKPTNQTMNRLNTEVLSGPVIDTIKLKVKDEKGEKKYKIGKSEPLRKLFEGFCKERGVNLVTMKFMFDGEILDGESTPEDHDMDDDDLIDAIVKK